MQEKISSPRLFFRFFKSDFLKLYMTPKIRKSKLKEILEARFNILCIYMYTGVNWFVILLYTCTGIGVAHTYRISPNSFIGLSFYA